jgi:hypothetical protein
LPGELLHWKPAPDRWSISEVLAHLAALEQVYAERMLRMIAEDSPALTKYDLAGAAARGEYSRGSAGENLALFTRTRRSTLALLTGLPASAGARTGVHSELGTRSRSRTCSTSGPVMTSGICDRLRSFIARANFIHTPGRS